eukprot:1234140-Prymnesium_polylepis.1
MSSVSQAHHASGAELILGAWASPSRSKSRRCGAESRAPRRSVRCFSSSFVIRLLRRSGPQSEWKGDNDAVFHVNSSFCSARLVV